MSWPVVPLGEVALLIRNGIFARRPTNEPGGAQILRISAVRDGRVNLTDAKYVTGLERDQLHRFTLDPGDLLMTRYNGSRSFVGISGMVPPHTKPVIHPDKLIRVVVDRSRAEPAFINYQMASPRVRSFMEPRIRTTAGQSGIAGADVRSIPIALPPLDEQRRIVEALEAHLSRLDAAAAQVESSAERALTVRLSALNRFDGGRLTRLGDLAVEAGYGTSTKCEVGGKGVAVVRIPNLVGGAIDMVTEKRAVNAKVDLSNYMLSAGDILIVRTNGSVDLIGRSAVAPEALHAAFASYLIRYRVDRTRVRPEWVSAMLSSPRVRHRVESLAASSAGQHNLSLGKLNVIELPVPALHEQDQRLERLANLDLELGRLRREIARTQRRATKLRAALLSAAFNGQLIGPANNKLQIL